MKIGIIGPSKLIGKKETISHLAELIAKKKYEIVVCADKGSSTEFFAQKYIRFGGKKVYSVLPLDDKEFGYSFVNDKLGEIINCGTWRNQPEKLNEETEVLLCIGYAVGALIEIAYSKWFKPKPVYVIKELISCELPKELERNLDLRYVSYKNLKIK